MIQLDETTDKNDIKLIDFEYASMNFRGNDFGDHFTEYAIDYEVIKDPFYKID